MTDAEPPVPALQQAADSAAAALVDTIGYNEAARAVLDSSSSWLWNEG